MNDKDISSLSHSKWRCHYHVVFAPKFRRKEIYGKIKTDIGKILRQLCEQKGIEIIEAELCPDHVHMLISIEISLEVCNVNTLILFACKLFLELGSISRNRAHQVYKVDKVLRANDKHSLKISF